MQPEEISIAIICPLAIEVAAMLQMLDERCGTQQFPRDSNLYHFGRIGKHNIAIAGLPDGLTGIASATTVAERLWLTFHSVKALLLVGIGGGVRTTKNDMRLGDVVVSCPDGRYGGVVQYDFGKSFSEGRFEYTNALNSPPREVLVTLAAMKANHLVDGAQRPDYLIYLEASQSNPHLQFPGAENDILFEADYEHAGGSACASCDMAREIKREPRKTKGPVVHYGTIASANQLMRDSKKRDSYNRDYDSRILCFEMEAAGLMNSTPCLVIRGISDYADSHKREDHAWHGYAAAAAAALAKEFIKTMPSCGLTSMATLAEALTKDDIPKAHWLVPFQRNAHFIGRKSQLNELDTKLSSDVRCQCVAVVGLGGVGKTQVVLEFAYRKREISPDLSILWIPALNPVTFEQAYLLIGQLLQIPGIVEESADVKQLVKSWLSRESAGKWLLILDNADDIDMLYKRAYGENGSLALIDYLPSSRYGSIIFTTRTRKAAVRQAGSNIVGVYEMDQAEAREVLEKSLIQTHILKEEKDIAKLLELLTCLPLAIVQAAAFINANEMSISAYISLYENGEDEIIELLSEDFQDQGRYRDTKNPIASTWLISFNQIRLQDQLAADYLSFMSCLLSQRIPGSLLPSAQTKIEMVKAIGTLTAYSFITKRETENSFDLHRLVHLATRNWLRKTQSLAAWTERTLSQLADVFPSDDYKNRAIWTAYIPHARHILALPRPPDGNEEIVIKLLSKVGSCLHCNGQFIEAEQAQRQALELRVKLLGPEHPCTLTSMSELGVALAGQGKYIEAEQMHRQALEFRVKLLGPEHPDTLRSMNSIGVVLNGQGKYVEAEQTQRQALELCRKVLGPEHPDTLRSMNGLGVALHWLDRYAEAEQVHRQTLELRVELLGPEHPETLRSMNNLGVALARQGKSVEAEQTHRQTLELRAKFLGPEHPSTLLSMIFLGRALQGQGKYAEAEQIQRQALKFTMKVLGPEHPDTLRNMNSLGVALHRLGKYVEAEQVHRQTLELRVKLLGPEHPETLRSMNNVGAALARQGKFIEAEKAQRQALELRVRLLGPGRPSTLFSMISLGRVLHGQGKCAEAEQIQRQALELYQKVLGPEHPYTLTSMSELGVALAVKGEYIEAEQTQRQAMELRVKVLGPEHPYTLISMSELGVALTGQSKYIEAEQTQRQSLGLMVKVLGQEHPQTLSSTSELGVALAGQGKYPEAEQAQRQALELMVKVLGPEHPYTLTCMSELGVALTGQGKHIEAKWMMQQTLKLRVKVLGPEHPHTLRSMSALGMALARQDKPVE